MQEILNDHCIVTLNKISLVEQNILWTTSFLRLEQRFFELLDGEKVMDALTTLM